MPLPPPPAVPSKRAQSAVFLPRRLSTLSPGSGHVIPDNPPRRQSMSKRPPQHRFRTQDLEGSFGSSSFADAPPLAPARGGGADAAAVDRFNGALNDVEIVFAESEEEATPRQPQAQQQQQQQQQYYPPAAAQRYATPPQPAIVVGGNQRQPSLNEWTFPTEEPPLRSQNNRSVHQQPQPQQPYRQQQQQQQQQVLSSHQPYPQLQQQSLPAARPQEVVSLANYPQGATAAAAAGGPSKDPLRSPYCRVSGPEVSAPLPRLQATTEVAADRTKHLVFQFMASRCPERATLDIIDKIMQQFDGREGLLIEALSSVFGEQWHVTSEPVPLLQEKAETAEKQVRVVRKRSIEPAKTTEYLALEAPPGSLQITAASPEPAASSMGVKNSNILDAEDRNPDDNAVRAWIPPTTPTSTQPASQSGKVTWGEDGLLQLPDEAASSSSLLPSPHHHAGGGGGLSDSDRGAKAPSPSMQRAMALNDVMRFPKGEGLQTPAVPEDLAFRQ